MLRLMTPRAVLLGLAFLLVGVSALLDEGAGVWAGKSNVGEGALKKGRARRMEPKFVTPHKPENRRRHDWNMFDEEGESPTRRKRAPKKTRRMAAEEKYKYEMEKRKRMERRTREARIAENEGEWRGEGERRRMRKVRSAENEGGWRNEGQRKKMRRVRRAENEGEWKGEGKRRRIRKLKKTGNEGESRNAGDRRRRKEEKKAEKGGGGGGRGQGRKENGNTIVNNGKGEKFGSKRGEKMKKKTEEANKERRKEVKKMTKKLDDTTRRKVATKDKDKKNKNKKKKEKGSGEETYVLGEVTTKLNSDSKGKCIATDAVLGTDSVVVYTTNQKKKSKCKIKIRGKKGTKLTMQCSRFSLEDSGCNAETLQVFDKGSKETTKFCQDDNPGDAFSLSTSNQIQLKYKKKKFRKKDSEVSLGFVCKVAVEGSTQADLLLGNEEDCGKTFDLEIGQSAVVASTASGGSCSISLSGKSGSVLSIECPYLNFKRKCRAEDLYVEDLNGFESFRLCKGSTDLPFSVTTSRMRLTYTRDKATQWGDFVCRITAVDWWGSSEGNENFEAPGYSSRGAYLFPHTSCPDKTSLSGADAECRSVCSRDFHCPALQYCCLNTCDRRCVTPQLLDTGDDCGCSVSFLPMKQANDLSPDFVKINAKVVNFIWLSVKDSFSPSMEVHLLDTNFRTTGIGQVDSLCQLENIMQFEFRTKKLDLFKKPHRKLFVIGDDVDFFTRVTEAGALGEIFESVCAVAVGNVTLSDSLLSQFASTASPGEPCVWRVDSYDQLGDLQPEVEAVINDGNCLCQGDTKGQGACAGPGESCVLDEDCGLMGDCVSGVCRERPCHVPDSYDPSSDINYDYYVEDYYYYYADYYNYFDEYGAGLHIAYDYFYDDGDASIRKQLERSSNTLSQKEKPTLAVREVFTVIEGCCGKGRLMCSGVPAVCVSPDSVCDGTVDCINGDDETPEACEKRVCGEGRFQCSSGECVSRRKVCDAEVDCPDGSDEFCRNFTDCPAPRSHYCSSGECIGLHQICDGELDCLSGEDEIPCQCLNFKCLSGECISTFDECDGTQSCRDGSDEHCVPPNGDPCPPSFPVSCNDGKCIFTFNLCDGFKQCADGSDEDPEVCATSGCSRCESGECIDPDLYCDGVDDCEDGSDESDCQSFECPGGSFHCTSGECLVADVVCNGREDCRDGSDEASCTSASCPTSRPLFCSSGECISFGQACDGSFDCKDRSDESRCPDIPCPPHRVFRCATGQCLNVYFDPQCDGTESCVDGSDEASCDSFQCPEDRSYKCDSGECLFDYGVECDGDRNCQDGSDENNCDITGPCPDSDDIRCSSGDCVWNGFWCDGRIDCIDGSDETDCQSFTCPENRPFQCESGECLFGSYACDGWFNCKDGSDENNCKDQACYGGRISCEFGECIYNWSRCDGYPDCRDGNDEASCSEFTCPAIRPFHCDSGECRRPYHRCDGFVQCSDGSDEINCSNFTCPDNRPFKCASGICITIYQVCNGFDDCGDGSDEVDCQDFKCPPETAFQCPEGNCIPVRFVCNGDRNCLGGGDEENCENYEVQCPKKFKCEADNKCIRLSWVCDDFEDCSDGSDEENCG